MSLSTTDLHGDGWQAGMKLLSDGDAAGAVATLQPYVTANPKSFEGHNFLGAALAQLGRHEEAIKFLQIATGLNTQSAPARFNLGLSYEKLGRLDAARREYKETLRIDPKHAGALMATTRLDAGTPATPLATAAPGGATPWASGEAATRQLGAQQIAEQERAERPDIANVAGGFMMAAVASFICAIIWDKLSFYTGYQIGYVAVGVGFVVGIATMFGASGKRGIALQLISALFSLGGILLGETLLVADYLRSSPTSGAASATFLQTFIVSVIILPQVLTKSPLSFLFMILGVYYGWTLPAPAKKVTQAAPQPLQTQGSPAVTAPFSSPAFPGSEAKPPAPSQNSPFDAPPKN